VSEIRRDVAEIKEDIARKKTTGELKHAVIIIIIIIIITTTIIYSAVIMAESLREQSVHTMNTIVVPHVHCENKVR